MQISKKISLVFLVVVYLLAGINHFRNPVSYLHIIPHYLPFPVILNILAGIFEIVFALLLIWPKTRKLGAYGIILLLILFLSVHITMIGNAPLKLGNILVTPTLAWIRLLFQPVLMLWSWWHRK